MSVWAIVLGGGSGTRFGGGVAKQFLDLGGRSLIEHAIVASRAVADGVVAVVPDPADPAVTALDVEAVTRGGASRAASTRAGLAVVPAEADIVLVADAAHPLAPVALYSAVVQAVRDGAEGAFPGLPLVDVVAQLAPDGARGRSLDRSAHVSVQVPQAFRADVLRAAHARAIEGLDADSALDALALVEDSGLVSAMTVAGRPARVVSVPGDPRNVHITTPAELEMARALVAAGVGV